MAIQVEKTANTNKKAIMKEKFFISVRLFIVAFGDTVKGALPRKPNSFSLVRGKDNLVVFTTS